jgi:hypothetical protein
MPSRIADILRRRIAEWRARLERLAQLLSTP